MKDFKYSTRLFLLLFFFSTLTTHAQTFEAVGPGLPGVGDASLDWGDYDGDGDLDLLIAGKSYTDVITRLYQNNGGTFEEVSGTPFIGVYLGDVAFGDFDADGDPDLIISGLMGNDVPTTQVYRNDNGTFVDINAGITALQAGMLDWGDYDGDGDLDLFIAGANSSGLSVSKVYRNTGSRFRDVGAGLLGLRRGDAKWFPYGAGMGLMVSGRDTQNNRHSIVYQYANGAFSEAGYNVPDVDLSAFTVSENESSQKVVVAGTSSSGPILQVYEDPNDTSPSLIGSWDGVEFASADWADQVDNFKQFVVMGRNGNGDTVTRLFKGTSHSNFEEIDTYLPGLYKGEIKWGDFDGDGDDDLAIAGYDGTDYPWTFIYKNITASDNDAPTPPHNIWVEKTASATLLKWTYGLDSETEANDLSYEVRVGTSPGGQDVIAPPASGPAGVGMVKELDVSLLGAGTYYWAARTVDEANARSPYTSEQIFAIGEDGFSLVSTPFESVAQKGVWADIDSDGDLDAILTGHVTEGQSFAKIYKNNGGTFTDANASLAGIYRGSSELSDIDNDGDLDLLIHGEVTEADDGVTQMYLNNNGTFTAFNTDFGLLKKYEAYVSEGAYESVRFADVDNDGDQDLVFSWIDGIRVIQNLGGVFSDQVEFRGGWDLNGNLSVADYDNDQDIDLILTGLETGAYKNPNTWLYENEGGEFEFMPDLVGVAFGTPAWADFDNDGDLDFVNNGRATNVSEASIFQQDLTTFYRNDGDVFTLEDALLPYYKSFSRSVWGDYDNDGDLDLLISGAYASPLYENRNGIFVNIVDAFDGFEVAYANWGDYDRDGDLDVLLTGRDHAGNPVTELYRNNSGPKNDAPTVPVNLSSTVTGSNVSLAWTAGNDEETAVAALSYNLRVGTTPGGAEILSAPATLDGSLQLPVLGNVYQNKSWKLYGLEDGTYYWSVQAIDGGWAGSAFAATSTFTIDTGDNPPPPPGDIDFANAGIDLPDLREGAMAWGDYDNDKDLDLLITGNTSNQRLTKIYKNTNNTLVDSGIDLPGLDLSAVTWGDYDNDGDLDFAMNGRDARWKFKTYLFRNTGSGFVEVSAGLPGLIAGAIDFGDYDNDGDLDLLMTGRLSNLNNYAAVFENENGSFSDIHAGLQGIRRGEAQWIDFDVDGDLDIMLTGRINENIDRRTLIYENVDGSFTPVNHNLPDVDLSSFDWGDFDGDGDPDLLITGTTGSSRVAHVYENRITEFVYNAQNLEEAEFSTARWADFDNDGDLDAVLGGQNDAGRFTTLYQNTQGSLEALNVVLTGVSKGASAWADYDQDMDLDLVVMGELSSVQRSTEVYNNESTVKNVAPAVVTGLAAAVGDATVTLLWNAGTDMQTVSEALTYNVRVGTTPGGHEILSAPAHADGILKVATTGNVGQNLSWELKSLPAGTYYWSVQAIDPVFAGSVFANEASFTVTASQAVKSPVEDVAGLSNYPNPFNPTTEIRYALAGPSQVELHVYDLTGKTVATLVNGFQEAGQQRALFDATHLASGVYMAVLKTEQLVVTKKLVLLK